MHQTEQEISFHEEVLHHLPEAVIWTRPVYDIHSAIIDFEIVFTNSCAERSFQSPGFSRGRLLVKDGLPSKETSKESFQHFLRAFQTGNEERFSFHNAHKSADYEAVLRKCRNGILCFMQDHKQQIIAEQKAEAQSELLSGIIQHAPVGIVVYEAVRDNSNAIQDFRCKAFNERINHLTGITDEQRRNLTLKQLLEGTGIEQNFERYRTTVETGEPFHFETFFGRTQKWLLFNGVKLGDGFVSIITDTTEKKQQQEAIQHQSDHLNSILNASMNAIVTMKAIRDENNNIIDLRYMQVNRAFLQIVGKTEQEVIGNTLCALFPYTRLFGILDNYISVINTGMHQRMEVYYNGDGLDAWLDISITRLDEETAVGTFNDITQNKKAAIEINNQKTLLDNILKYSSSGISVTEFIRDDNGKIIDGRTILANEAAIRYTGLSRELYFTKTACEIDPNILHSPLFKLTLNTMETGEPFHIQYLIEPTQRWLELSVSKMDDNHTINVFTDITASKELQLHQEKLLEELKRSNTNLEEFAYAASHDLKEPLRKIHTFSDRLKGSLGTRLTEEESRLFNRMESATNRMRHLVDDLLEFAQVSIRPHETEAVDLNEKVQAVLLDLDVLIEEKKAIITTGTLPTVKGHRRQLQQLFQNLIGNALKYAKNNEAPRISIKATIVSGKELGNNVTADDLQKQFHAISVADNGIGFEQEYAERIFQMFQRLHGKAEYAGTGVGLSIAQKVAQNHGGYIKAEGIPGIGATFTVYLPI